MDALEIEKLTKKLCLKVEHEPDYFQWIRDLYPNVPNKFLDDVTELQCVRATLRLNDVFIQHIFLVDPPEQVKLAMADLILTYDLTNDIIEAIKAEEYSKVCFLIKDKKDAGQTSARLKRNALLVQSIIKNPA